jgi:hypothetical protein
MADSRRKYNKFCSYFVKKKKSCIGALCENFVTEANLTPRAIRANQVNRTPTQIKNRGIATVDFFRRMDLKTPLRRILYKIG